MGIGRSVSSMDTIAPCGRTRSTVVSQWRMSLKIAWRGARVVEGARLESVYPDRSSDQVDWFILSEYISLVIYNISIA